MQPADPATDRFILTQIARGLTPVRAAQSAGVDPDYVAARAAADPGFASSVANAEELYSHQVEMQVIARSMSQLEELQKIVTGATDMKERLEACEKILHLTSEVMEKYDWPLSPEAAEKLQEAAEKLNIRNTDDFKMDVLEMELLSGMSEQFADPG